MTKDDLKRAFAIIKDAQQTKASDEATIADLNTRIGQFQADHDLVNDPELNGLLTEVLANAVAAAPPAPTDTAAVQG